MPALQREVQPHQTSVLEFEDKAALPRAQKSSGW